MASIDGGNINPDQGITDPTGGAPNFNIEDIFKSFGYTPTQAEISALAPAFEGRTNVGQTGTSAVAEYVQAHQALGQAQSAIQGNLLDEQTAAKNADTLGQVLETQGQEAYDAASAVYAQAPKLFGSLTADQIGTYLAPAKQAFDQAQGSAEGAASARGVSGSSIEGNAIGQNLTNFMQNVLSQGLGIGMTQQTNQANVLQAKGAQDFGAGQQQFGLGVQDRSLATTSAGQNYQAASGISGLAGSAVNQAITQQAAIKALNPQQQSFGGKLASGFENMAVQDILNLGQNITPGIFKPNMGLQLPGFGGGGGAPSMSPTGTNLRTGADGASGASGAGAATTGVDYTSGLVDLA